MTDHMTARPESAGEPVKTALVGLQREFVQAVADMCPQTLQSLGVLDLGGTQGDIIHNGLTWRDALVLVVGMTELTAEAKRFLKEVVPDKIQVMVAAVYARSGPSLHPEKRREVVQTIRADVENRLGSRGRCIPVETVVLGCADHVRTRPVVPGLGELDTLAKVRERMQVFAEAAHEVRKYSETIKGDEAGRGKNGVHKLTAELSRATLCRSERQLRSYLEDWEHRRASMAKLKFISNRLLLKAEVELRRDGDAWGMKVESLDCERLKLDRDFFPAIADLSSFVEAGLFCPELLRQSINDAVGAKLAQHGIGCDCHVELTVVCPDNETLFHIQQSAVLLKVRP